MTIRELIASVSEKTGYTKKDTEAVVRAAFEVIADELIAGNEVSIPGFGKFDVVSRAARIGRNPQTGEEIQIPERKAVKFKVSSTLKGTIK